MYYQEFNPSAKNTIVLIHGLGASSEMWEFQFEPLTKAGYRVIAPDMPGFGKSPESNETLTIESMADEVANLMRDLKIAKANIIGLSMGGAIAQKFALKHPEKLERLILSNTAARFANKIFGIKYLALRYLMLKIIPRRSGAKSIAKFVFPKKDQQYFRDEFIKQILQASDKAYFQATKAIIDHDLRKEITNIKAPTLLVSGKEDRLTMPFQLRKINGLIPHSKLVMLAGGHVTPVDSADDFNREILAFLDKNN